MHFFTNYYGRLEIKYLAGGYLPVEFFFILTGFFLSQQVEQKEEYNIIDFIIKRLRKVYIIYCIGSLSMIVYSFFSMQQFTFFSLHVILEILLLSAFYGPVNPPSWFLSVLMWFLPIIYVCLNKYPKKTYIFAPYCIIIIYFNFLYMFGMLDVWYQPFGLFFSGVYRGLAGILLGCLTYKIHIRIKNVNMPRVVILGGEVLVLGCILNMIVGNARNPNDFVAPILFVLLVLLANFPQISFIKKLNNRAVYFLGKLSFSLFLNHWIVFSVLFLYYKNLNVKILFILFVFISLVWSSVVLYLSQILMRRLFTK